MRTSATCRNDQRNGVEGIYNDIEMIEDPPHPGLPGLWPGVLHQREGLYQVRQGGSDHPFWIYGGCLAVPHCDNGSGRELRSQLV